SSALTFACSECRLITLPLNRRRARRRAPNFYIQCRRIKLSATDGHLFMKLPGLPSVRGDDAPPAEGLFGDLREYPTHRRAFGIMPFEHYLVADFARDEC